MMGLEPTTFAMARRRSSQLSYIRVGVSIGQPFRRGRDHRFGCVIGRAELTVGEATTTKEPWLDHHITD